MTLHKAKAQMIILFMLLISSVAGTNTYSWPDAITYPNKTLAGLSQQSFIESSVFSALSLGNLKHPSQNEEVFDFQTKLSTSLCEAYNFAIFQGQGLVLYIVSGNSSAILIYYLCPNSNFSLIEVNLDKFIKSPELEKEKISYFIEKTVYKPNSNVEIVDLRREGFEFITGYNKYQYKKRRISLLDDYNTLKIEFGVITAVGLMGGDPNLDASLISLMFSDIVTYTSDLVFLDPSTFAIINSDILQLFGREHEANLTLQLIDQYFGFPWDNYTLIKEVPDDDDFYLILDQSSLYIYYHDYNQSAYITVEAKLAVFFQNYANSAYTYGGAPVEVSCSSYLNPQVSIKCEKVEAGNLPGLQSTLGNYSLEFVENNYLFDAGTVGAYFWSVFYRTDNTSQAIGIRWYTAGTYDPEQLTTQVNDTNEVEIAVGSYAYQANFIVPNNFVTGSAVYCTNQPCVLISHNTSNVTIKVGSTGMFFIQEFNCTNHTALYNEYILYRDSQGSNFAIADYSQDDAADTCLLIQIWLDIKAYLQQSFVSPFNYEFVNDNSLNLIQEGHFANLTGDLVYDIYGYSWITDSYFPSNPTNQTLQDVLDQSALYLSYFQNSEAAFQKVDSSLSSYLVLYSNVSLYLYGSPINGSSSSGLAYAITIYKEKILSTKTLSFSLPILYANPTFAGTSPLPNGEILSVLFILYQGPTLISDDFSSHLYYAGYYNNSNLIQISNYLEQEVTSSLQSLSLSATLTIHASASVTIACMYSQCSVQNKSLDSFTATVYTQGLQLFQQVCSNSQMWNEDSQSCENPCPVYCESCNLDGQCTNCSFGYQLSNNSCITCNVLNCLECSINDICSSCSSTYQLTTSGSCVDCIIENCKICNENATCNSCLMGYKLGTAGNCVLCSDKNCNTCSSDNNCYSCIPGYKLSSTGMCVICSDPNCIACSDNNKCSQCKNFYFINGLNGCSPCLAPCASCMITASSCIACGNLALLSSGFCRCVANAQFASNNKDCICLENYVQVAVTGVSQCLICLQYITSSDIIDVSYDNSFSHIYLNFKVNIKSIFSCSSLVADVSIFGLGGICSSVNSTQVQVTLGTNWKALNKITLNPSGVLLSDNSGACTTPAPLLTSPVTHNSNVSAPIAMIIGSTKVYTSFTTAPDQIFSGANSTDPTGLGLSYIWLYSNSSSLPNKAALDSLVALQNDSILILSISTCFLDYSGSISLSLTATNQFNESSTYVLEINFFAAKAISLQIDSADVYYLYVNNALEFTVSITDYCGASGAANYIWKLESTSDNNPDPFLYSLSTTRDLSIEKNTLKAGQCYNFSVTASVARLIGAAHLTIFTLFKALMIYVDAPEVFNLESGRGLEISANRSSDPNDKNSVFAYKWSCTVNLTECPSTLTAVFSAAAGSNIKIDPSLLTGLACLNVTLNASASNLYGLATRNITFNKNSSLSVLIYGPTSKIAIYKPLSIYSKILLLNQNIPQVEFTWMASDSATLQLSHYSFLYINAATLLLPGHTYYLSLKVVEESTYSIVLSIKTNYPPICNYVNVDKLAGYALFDLFTFTASCYDGDEEDYPLYNRIGYYSSKIAKDIKIHSDITTTQARFSAGNITAYYCMCDALDDCWTKLFNLTVLIKTSRNLTDCMSEYLTIVQDNPDEIPGSIEMMTGTYNLTSDDMEIFYENLTNYKTPDKISTNVQLNLVLGACEALMRTVYNSSIDGNYLIKVAEYVDLLLTSYNATFDESTMNLMGIIAQDVISYDSLNSTLLNVSRSLAIIAQHYFFLDKMTGYAYEQDLSLMSLKQLKVDYDLNKNLPLDLVNETFLYADLPVNDTFQVNVLIIKYETVSAIGDAVEVRLATAGQMVNLSFYPTSELAITQFAVPVQITINAYKNITTDYRCGYLNDLNEYSTDGCQLISVTNDSLKIRATLEISHTTMFVLLEPLNCSYNFSPLVILSVLLFLEIFFIPFLLLLDNLHKDVSESNPSREPGFFKTTDSFPNSTFMLTERPVGSHSMSFPIEEERSESAIHEPENADYTVEFVLKPFNILEQELASEHKNEFESLIEGHLLFGLFVFRSSYKRWLRFITLITTIMLQLLLQGLLYYGVFEYKSGTNKSTQQLFHDYKQEYFGLTLVSLAITLPVEMFWIVVFSLDKRKYAIWFFVGILLALGATVGSIAGVFILNFMFCFEWAGYWAISFLWSMLIEIFGFQVFYMLVRFPLKKRQKNVGRVANLDSTVITN